MLIGTLIFFAAGAWVLYKLPDLRRRPLTLSAAVLLRRMGRWLWAAGEGLECGFLHSRQVRRQIPLDLEAQP
jgi:hypothetical protein